MAAWEVSNAGTPPGTRTVGMQATTTSERGGGHRKVLYGVFGVLGAIPVVLFVLIGLDSGGFALDGSGGPLIAFSAGVLSFLSPCVLPIVPIYITNLAGATVENGVVKADRTKTFTHSIAFILGLTGIFVVLGGSAGVIGFGLVDHTRELEIGAGVLMIVLGALLIPTYGRRSQTQSAIALLAGAAIFVAIVQFADLREDSTRMGLLAAAGLVAWAKYSGYIQFNILQRTFKSNIGGGSNVGYGRSFLVGGAFATGWTPCIGPILGGILTLAAQSGDAVTGIYLLLFYSAGFSIPFLIAGLAVGDVTAATKKIQKYMPMFEVASAVMLLAIGALLLSGGLTSLNEWTAQYFSFGELSSGL